MGTAANLDDALRIFCLQYGWSYGAYWRAADPRDPGLLCMEGAYCEEHLRELLIADALLCQVQRVGQGPVGDVVLQRKHRWIFSDDAHLNDDSNPGPLQDDHALWSCQFIAGIKTIAIIPLPDLDVVQFGSTKKIQETSEFINKVYSALQMPNFSSGTSGYHNASKVSAEINEPFDTFGYSTTTGDSFSSFEIKREPDQNQFEIGTLPHSTALPTSSCLNVSMPLVSLDQVCLYQDHSYLLTKHHQPTLGGDGLPVSTGSMLLPDALHATSSSPMNSLTSSQQPSTSGNRVFNFLEQQVTGIMELQQFGRNQQSNILAYLKGDSPATSTYNLPMHAVSNEGGPLEMRNFAHIPHSLPASIDGIQANCKDLSEALFPYHSQASTSAIFTTTHEDLPAQRGSFSTSLPEMINTQASESCTAKHDKNVLALPKLEADFDAISMSSGLCGIPVSGFSNPCLENPASCPSSSNVSVSGTKKLNVNPTMASFSDVDLYKGMERYKCWDGLMMPGSATCSTVSRLPFESILELEGGTFEGHGKDFFSGLEQIVGSLSDGNSSANSQSQFATANLGDGLSCSNQGASTGRSRFNGSTNFFSNLEKLIQSSTKNENSMKSLIESFVDDRDNMNAATRNGVTTHPKKPDEQVKVIRKRARPGESTRPRPKDRQLIQDRVKELREIVPNGAKCSIDALLDRTIKHMLYLQNVTRYADKLKQSDEPKMIGEESGVVLRDNSSSGGGGATWAFEVAGQTMVCPIIVEDLSPPGQMLIEMLCEDRGIFLEIADRIGGFGLNILKGVMEVRDRKLWARFLVEANREVTRMEIFLSLVQLLQQTNSNSGSNGISAFDGCKQSPLPIPISLTDDLY